MPTTAGAVAPPHSHAAGAIPIDTITRPTCWLSILIPAWNVEEFVGECLRSIIVQSAPGVEIVVVDDASEDSTGSVAAEFQQRHPGLITMHRHADNRGIGTTRNHLVEMARGDYIWFIDADDTMMPGAMASLKRIVDDHGPDLVLCDYVRRWSGRQRRGTTFAGPQRTLVKDASVLVAGMFEAGQLHPWSKISRRSLWAGDLRFPHGRVFEDVTAMPRMAVRATTCYYEPEPWIAYRQWSGSILATMNPRKCVDLTRALADFPAAMRADRVRLSGQALFALRHYAARHFVGAMRHLSRWDEPTVARHASAECLGYFLQAIEEQYQWLCAQYLRRGWLWRWMRLRYWVGVAS